MMVGYSRLSAASQPHVASNELLLLCAGFGAVPVARGGKERRVL